MRHIKTAKQRLKPPKKRSSPPDTTERRAAIAHRVLIQNPTGHFTRQGRKAPS